MTRSGIKYNITERKLMDTLKVVRKEGNDFVVKVPERQDLVKIEDIFAETFSFMGIIHSEI